MDVIIGIWSDTKEFRDNNYGSNATINVLVDGLDEKSKPFADGLNQHGISVLNFKDKDGLKQSLATVS
jgi:hypothetical protein